MGQAVKQTFIMYVVATIGCIIGVFVAVGIDLEVIGLALLASLFLLPSIIGYNVLNKIKPTQKQLRNLVYFVPVVCLLIFGGVIAASGGEGSGFGRIYAIVFSIGGALGYLPAILTLKNE